MQPLHTPAPQNTPPSAQSIPCSVGSHTATPLAQRGLGVTSSVPTTATGTPPIPAAAAAGAGGLSPPRVSVPGPVQMAEPGSSCPHGGDGANVTPATWHRELALSCPCLLPWDPPLSKRHLPGGGLRQHPQSCREHGGHRHRWVGDRDGGVTGVAGGVTTATIYLGASTAPPAAQMSPRASRSGYRLRLQLPFIAPLPGPCSLSLSPPHRPPGGDAASEPPRAPQATEGGRPRHGHRAWWGPRGHLGWLCHPPWVPRGGPSCWVPPRHSPGDTHGCPDTSVPARRPCWWSARAAW